MAVLLAPVPREHISSARERAAAMGGYVAFGSSAAMWELFAKVVPETDVLIHVSGTGKGEHYGGVFSHAAIFDRVVGDEREVRQLRPSTTASDTPHGCYWVVRDFRKLAEAEFVPFSAYGVKVPFRHAQLK